MHKLEISGFIRGLLPGTLGILAIAAAILVQTSLGFSNDSIARFGAGGIEFTKNEDIRCLEEVLEISTKKIRVKYRFLNESDKDIHTRVAFPLPKYDPLRGHYSSEDEPRLIMASFNVLVNGWPVAKQNICKAFVADRDVTHTLRKSGLSDKDIFFGFRYDQDNSPLSKKFVQLRKEIGDWKTEETAFWQQIFPSKRETVVEHEYVPVVGGGFAPNWKTYEEEGNVDEFWKSFTGMRDDKDEACLDEITKRAMEKRFRTMYSTSAESVWVWHRNVEYILGTGRNWKGPIGEFRLRLVKEKPEEFVSVCFPGKPEKISPTVYEFVQKDYVPQDKLVVYFYTVGEIQ